MTFLLCESIITKDLHELYGYFSADGVYSSSLSNFIAPLLCIEEPVFGATVVINCSYWAAYAAGLQSVESMTEFILHDIDEDLYLSMFLAAAY